MISLTTNHDLPDHIRGALPLAAQTRFRQVAKRALDAKQPEKVAFAQAWNVVKKDWEKGSSGRWARKACGTSHDMKHPDEEDETAKKLGVGATASDYIHDFVNSDNPRFKGKSKKERIRMALGAYYGSNKVLEKAFPRSLYVCRYVQNTSDIIKWAKAQGFTTTLPADELHVTVIHSKTPVDWMKAGDYPPAGDTEGNITVKPGGPRIVESLGGKGAVVLSFACYELSWRHDELKKLGAKSDYDTYQPHVTITWDAGDMDLSTVEPYTGEIVLGPEIFKEVDDEWSSKITEKFDATIVKVDESLGLVFGYAIICKQNGQDYYDLNKDRETGERVPEHIPEHSMLEAATDFMLNSRMAKEMHDGDEQGSVVFAFPLTTDIAKALNIQTPTTGLLIAMKPSKDMLGKFVRKELTGFSIGGSKQKVREEEYEA